MSGGSSRPFTGALANQDTFQILDRPAAWIIDWFPLSPVGRHRLGLKFSPPET